MISLTKQLPARLNNYLIAIRACRLPESQLSDSLECSCHITLHEGHEGHVIDDKIINYPNNFENMK